MSDVDRNVHACLSALGVMPRECLVVQPLCVNTDSTEGPTGSLCGSRFSTFAAVVVTLRAGGEAGERGGPAAGAGGGGVDSSRSGGGHRSGVLVGGAGAFCA